MFKNFSLVALLLSIVFLVYFYPYLMGFQFPSGVDFASYYMEYKSYGTTEIIFESASIWYEPGYFMSLYVSDLLMGNFGFAFLSLEIITILSYFLAFYLLLGSWTKLSFRKKILISFIFSISLPQYFIFLHSIRKQFFDGVFFLLFLGMLPRCKNLYHQGILGIIFAEIFFAHRGVSFYLIMFPITFFLYGKEKMKRTYFRITLIALILGIAINISYLTPFVQIQSKLLLDTFNSLTKTLDGTIAPSNLGTPAVRSYGFDIFQSVGEGNPFLNYFFGFYIFFLIIISGFRNIKESIFTRYYVILNICIYLILTMSGRVAHLANIIGFLLFALILNRKRFLSIITIYYLIFTSMQTIALSNIKNHHFGVIDSFMQDFYKKVPTENTFLFSAGDNLFIRYSGYNSVGNFLRTTLGSSYEEYYNHGVLDANLSKFQKLFMLSGYNQVVLPESLKGYDIYVVFGLYYPGHLKAYQSSLGVVVKTPIEKLFAQSPFFERVDIDGFQDPRNRFQGSKYPISLVFRLKSAAPRKYIPDDEVEFEVGKIVRNLYN